MAQYRLTSYGPEDLLGAAQVPIRAPSAQAFQSRGFVNGSPGTTAIPAPRPSAVPQDKTAQASMGTFRSQYGPNFWWPGVYYEPGIQERVAVSIVSDNQLPLPAIDPRGRPAVMMGRPRLGGQFQVKTPKAPVVYRNLNG